MQYIVYVLIDESGKVYKGMTSNLRKRLYDHKSKHTRTTSRMGDLKVAYTEDFDTFESARKRELYFKSAAGRRFLKDKLGP
ncbi:GIY-YIG nuclease family protein [Candidatus Kaiserbacteria bacterium]|nr:GIY-YIG nuclease family protein [Candidatus Kaiserbacteria bacterium]